MLSVTFKRPTPNRTQDGNRLADSLQREKTLARMDGLLTAFNKLEPTLARPRTAPRIAVLHEAPVRKTGEGDFLKNRP